jgi:hypothetical protein
MDATVEPAADADKSGRASALAARIDAFMVEDDPDEKDEKDETEPSPNGTPEPPAVSAEPLGDGDVDVAVEIEDIELVDSPTTIAPPLASSAPRAILPLMTKPASAGQPPPPPPRGIIAIHAATGHGFGPRACAGGEAL